MAEQPVPAKVVKEILDFQQTLEAFISALNNGGYFRGNSTDGVRDALYILEKPWKWQTELAEWEVLGYPHEYNPDYAEDLEIDISDAQILSFFNR
jgi:hypothetical protein